MFILGSLLLNVLGCDQRLGVAETVRHKVRERDGGKGGKGREGGPEFIICIYLFFCNHKDIAYQFKTVRL